METRGVEFYVGQTQMLFSARPTFHWSDAWLLAAIFGANYFESAATLDQIIAYGDVLNHSIFNFEELESGLARLSAAGLIREEDLAFLPSGPAREWFEELRPLGLGGLATIEWVAAQLAEERGRLSSDYRDTRAYPGFSRARFDQAVAKYQSKAVHSTSRTL
jgi:hypothetical protein